jgi:hypothetical protein
MATKKKKDEDVQLYAYQVSTILQYQVLVTRFQMVRYTEKSVTVLTATGIEKRYARKSDRDEWFLSFNAAQKRALAIIDDYRVELAKVISTLDNNEKEIRARRIRETKPLKIGKIVL